jgi:DNA-binding PadR family transcriptional regulator
MQPFERFKKTNTEGNLWIYILELGKEEETPDSDVTKLVFEKFGFLPGELMTSSVLYKLRRGGFIKSEKFQGKKAFSTTEEGRRELEKMRGFCQGILEKI